MKRLQRTLERSLGPAGVVGLALLAGCIAFYWGGVRPVEGEVVALRAELEQLAGNSRREAPRQANPHEALAHFYGRFAAPAEVLGALDAVFNAAAREQVALDAGEYRVSREQGARLARYQIVLPVRGSYRSIRRFVVRALNNVPGLALDDLALRRDSTTSANVEARVQLTLYMGTGE